MHWEVTEPPTRLGISKERVRQLEHRAVEKLRSWAAEQSVQELVDPVLT